MRVDEHTTEVAGLPLFYRSAPAKGTPTLYLHGVPTSSEDWTALLERVGGIAPDLPGFGRSGKAGHLDYSLGGFADVLEALLAALEVDRFQLVGHSWGATAGLALAARRPERIERLTLFNPFVPSPAIEWPRLARIWRTRGVGELAMGFTTRWLMARMLRRGYAHPEACSGERVDSIWREFDQGTQRAVLLLHRSAGEILTGKLGALRAPASIVWGERDPWLQPAMADACARMLSNATVRRLTDAGHWPWLDQPDEIDATASLLGAG